MGNTTLCSELVLGPRALDVDQRALALAECEVLERGDRNESVVFGGVRQGRGSQRPLNVDSFGQTLRANSDLVVGVRARRPLALSLH